jgi:Ca-activated chloride channel family protein
MSFENLPLLFLLLVPFVLFAILVLTNKEGIERVFSKEVLDRIKVEGNGLSSRVRNLIFFMAILFMIIAIGHPYVLKGEKEIELNALETVVALDISGSMRSTDRYPNRLEFAKVKTKELLNNLVDDEVMLLTFSKDLYLVSPMTKDKDILKQVVDGINSDYLQGATNFTLLANVAKQKLKSKMQKILIVISDGAESEDLDNFEAVIKKEGIKLYAILVGTKEGSTVLDSKGKAILNNDKIVISRINERLGEIAKSSGGDYIIAKYGEDDTYELSKKISSNVAYSNGKKIIKVKDKIELFYYPLIVATILLIFAFSSPPSREDFKRSKE